MLSPVFRTILIYGALFAIGAVGLQWLEWRLLIRAHATESYVIVVALAFLGLGLWVGRRVFRRPPATTGFKPNTKAQESLEISGRELEVLRQLAAGRSNK